MFYPISFIYLCHASVLQHSLLPHLRTHRHILFTILHNPQLFLPGKIPFNLRWASYYQGAGWDYGVFGDEAAGADDTVGANFGAVQDDGAHSDEGAVADDAAVDDGVVADGDIVSDVDGHVAAYVDGAVFLDVGFCADGDGGVVAADDGVIQDAAVPADCYISKDDGLFRDSCAFIYFYIPIVHFSTSFCLCIGSLLMLREFHYS